MKKIILAGGCFWGVQAYYSRLKGVISTTVGYTDGETKNPSYTDICSNSGHVEACLIEYDEEIIPLLKILEHFFRIIDPTQKNRQGYDVGIQYRSAIFYFDPEDHEPISAFLHTAQKKYAKPLETYVKMATPFYDAETYHQHYLDKNPSGYCHVNLHLITNDEKK
ncbi:MAG: peptide-methionine (S)-S-oxide reductase MsrA [Candidatus Izemoplasmatales bacterium]|jgi:methionine-S-sulfoxide reductase|nr:peptide-methionine (S)-S-oxide reductase MsrA [Candidatus Izemoplasmatales bacterium]MDD3864911.1 peptide-methionine (S)-S-oxide reductase MsrA [Candidatus Izemoplasmatales bacterium]